MASRKNSARDPAHIAQLLTGAHAFREVILTGPGSGFRWHCHDYPYELARWNHHPEFELHLIRNANGRFVVGDYVGEFSPGNLCLIGPSLPHDWISSVPKGTRLINRDVVLQFDGESIAKALNFLPEAEPLERLLKKAARGIEFLGKTRRLAAPELIAMGNAKGMERLSCFFRLFAILAQAPKHEIRLLASPLFQPFKEGVAGPVLDQILDYISCHERNQVKMEHAARLVGMSPSGFSRFFKKASGRRFVETVRTLRIVHACRLLRETDKPIAEICFDSGYENLSNFNRRFREEMGVTPSTYRRKYVSEEVYG